MATFSTKEILEKGYEIEIKDIATEDIEMISQERTSFVRAANPDKPTTGKNQLNAWHQAPTDEASTAVYFGNRLHPHVPVKGVRSLSSPKEMETAKVEVVPRCPQQEQPAQQYNKPTAFTPHIRPKSVQQNRTVNAEERPTISRPEEAATTYIRPRVNTPTMRSNNVQQNVAVNHEVVETRVQQMKQSYVNVSTRVYIRDVGSKNDGRKGKETENTVQQQQQSCPNVNPFVFQPRSPQPVPFSGSSTLSRAQHGDAANRDVTMPLIPPPMFVVDINRYSISDISQHLAMLEQYDEQ